MEIKLGGKRGGIALVSPEDYEEVSKYSWQQNKQGYARGTVKRKSIGLSHFITKVERGVLVDHINQKRLDNRRENLRILDYEKNAQNRGISKTKKSSKYKCVFFNKTKNNYQTATRISGKRYNLGTFNNQIEAALHLNDYILL